LFWREVGFVPPEVEEAVPQRSKGRVSHLFKGNKPMRPLVRAIARATGQNN